MIAQPCIDCHRLTLCSLDAAGRQPICYRPCYLARQAERSGMSMSSKTTRAWIEGPRGGSDR